MNTVYFTASSQSPFMSLAYVWTGFAYFSKIHPCLMMYDGNLLSFIDKDSNVFMQLSNDMVETITYSNGRLNVKTKTKAIDDTDTFIVLFYEEMSEKAVVPSSYTTMYENFIRNLSETHAELAEAIHTDLSISEDIKKVQTRNPLRLASSIEAASKMNKTAATKDTVAQAWSQILAPNIHIQYGISVRELNKRVIMAIIAFIILSTLGFFILMIFQGS